MLVKEMFRVYVWYTSLYDEGSPENNLFASIRVSPFLLVVDVSVK